MFWWALKALVGIKRSEVVRLYPGDVITLRLKRVISDSEKDSMMHVLDKTFPDNKVLIIEGNADLEVVRPEARLSAKA